MIRRATFIGRAAGLVLSLGVLTWLLSVIGSGSRFLVLWAVLIVGCYYVASTLVRRVAFEVIRGRGVPPTSD